MEGEGQIVENLEGHCEDVSLFRKNGKLWRVLQRADTIQMFTRIPLIGAKKAGRN
jgi:hypothetical protein